MPWTDRSIDAEEARVHADDRSFHEKHGMFHVGDRTFYEKDGTFHLADRMLHQIHEMFHLCDRRFRRKYETVKVGDEPFPANDRTLHHRQGRFAKLGQFSREILNDYAAIVQPLHTAQPQPAAHQQYDRTSLAPRCHPPEAELRQPQRAGNTSRQQPTLSIWRFAIPACKRGKDAAVEVCPSRHSRHSSPLCRFAWNRPPAVASNRGAQQPGAAVLPAAKARSTAGEGWRSVPLRVSETPLRSGAWGWLQFFAASDRARPAARTSPPSRAGLGLGGARRARQGHPSHRRRFHTKRQKRPMRQPETVAFTLTVIAVAAAPDHERKFELGSDG
jgi:hypothetical protein